VAWYVKLQRKQVFIIIISDVNTYIWHRELDQACMEAVAALLQGLPLQPEESDRGDLMEAKSQLFLK